MATYANHLELFAEQIGPIGEQLGNFPQVFTHLVVINAAISLDDLLNRSERVGILLTWSGASAHLIALAWGSAVDVTKRPTAQWESQRHESH
jgi:hypothetical protein